MAEHDSPLRLQRFFPYRLATLQAAVSDCVGRLYHRRFALSHREWRVLATLAEFPGWSAREVAEHASLEKMPVSRAVSRLTARGLLTQAPDRRDGRVQRLWLTDEGERLYRRIVPLVLALEEALLEALTPAERAQLEALMDKLLARTAELSARDDLSPDR